MPDKPKGVLEVGRVGRPHGVKGDVFIDLTTDRSERAAVGSRIRIHDRWMTIAASSPSNHRWRVHLEGIDTREAAQELTGSLIYADPIDDPDEVWIHQLIGASVIESNGIDRGLCTAVVDNPASDLLELESGALVPAVFVTDVDIGPYGTLVTIDAPPGLFDLTDE